MNFGRLTVPQRISAVAMLVVALAAFLPWVSIFGISKTGIEGDGIITLILALAGLVILALTSGLVGSARTPGRLSQITLLVLAVLVALVGLFDMNGAAAMGLYLTLFGGIAWVVGAGWQLGLGKQTPTSVAEPGPAATPASQQDPSPAPATATAVPATAAGWLDDPTTPGQLRYWDGSAWTEHVSPK